MKILLDENIDIRFTSAFDDTIHEVFTVRDMNWTGVKNGQLLKLVEENMFDFWTVVDKNIPYQQNISNIRFSIIILDVYRNTLKHLLPLKDKILSQMVSAAEKIIVIRETNVN